MKKDRKELEQKLNNVIDEIKYNKRKIRDVNNYLHNHKLGGFINEVIRTPTLLSEMDAEILCLLTLAVFMVSGDENIRPENYFTDNEIETSKKYEANVQNDAKLPIELNNVLQIDYDRYLTFIPMVEIVKWVNSKIVHYDFSHQRSPDWKKGKDGVVPIPQTNKKSVAEIAELMEEDRYFTDTIRLNVYSDEVDPISYDSKKKTLIINEGAKVSVLDGQHRIEGAIMAYSNNPDLSLVEELSIRVYDTETAARFFGQISKVNPVPKERIEELDRKLVAFASVDKLKHNPHLKGRIASGSRVRDIAGHLTTESILAHAIDQMFEPTTLPQANAVGTYLSDFFSYLFAEFEDQINDKKSIYGHHRMFAGYIVLAKKMKDNNIELSELGKIVKSINPDENEELKEVVTYSRGTQDRLLKRVIEYFEKIDVKNLI